MRALGEAPPGDCETGAPEPNPSGRALLVRLDAVAAIAAPADGAGVQPPLDAVGEVTAAGPAARLFQPGDRVWFTGAGAGSAAGADLRLVDERMVGRAPDAADDAAAAAAPLAAITAYDMLFDRLGVGAADWGAGVLLIGADGAVGAIAVQLLRALTRATVIATAAQPAARARLRDGGAHHVLDAGAPLAQQIAALDVGPPRFVFSTADTHRHLDQIAALIAPQGALGLIDDPDALDLTALAPKSVGVHWRFMFARSPATTEDKIRQGEILNEVAALVDAGAIRLGPATKATAPPASGAPDDALTAGAGA